MSIQQGDISLFQTDNEGDITIEGGVATMNGGLETSAYLSLFGGDEDDNGQTGNSANWWANIDETDPAKEYHSETQNLLQSIPATSGNLRRVEDAARRDLEWFITSKAASSIDINVTIPGLNRVKITILIEARGEESSFDFVENWRAD